MTTAQPSTNPRKTVELSPSYTIPLVLIFGSIPLLLLNVWLGLAISLFGLFLLFQTVTLRLSFTETALDIYRSKNLIRRFPYSEWQNWRIFWPSFPVLLYFKEIKSIHFLPILFDPQSLKNCLEQYCPHR
jgi:hypothetical protein